MISQVSSGAVAVQVASPGAPVTTYSVMAEPPSDSGVVHVMVAEPMLAETVTSCGAVGATRLCSSVTVLLL
ncbi:unannotated protein [freshwater metagenome]|uniref:Unannotated protein n=1 Tax=freshwater metagenome TaxID=449393 RepID=A0A6J5YAG0_9ZZZZ